jgi:2-phosphosulfolactate phosphatase
MHKIEVCLSPDLLHLHDLSDDVVVVIDILRATSCMTTAMAHGADHIVPVATLEEAQDLKAAGYLVAGERNGEQVAGFNFGNSPFSFMSEQIKGRSLAMTTTNGTVTISKTKDAAMVVVGSFLNITALSNFLLRQEKNILLACAGWKGKVNLEDTLFAGALIHRLKEEFNPACDAALVAESVYLNGKQDKLKFLSNSSHVNRLKNLGIDKDISFCLQEDVYPVIPFLKGNRLIKI